MYLVGMVVWPDFGIIMVNRHFVIYQYQKKGEFGNLRNKWNDGLHQIYVCLSC